MRWTERMKKFVQNWLSIQPAPISTVQIREPMTFEANAVKNRIWYRGDASELEQLYKQLPGTVNAARFWAAAPESVKLRKIHSGLPSLMVDTLANLVKSDCNKPEFTAAEDQVRWEAVSKEIDFPSEVGAAVREVLAVGDGAFKLSVDQSISDFPLLEFVSGENVAYTTQRGRIIEVHFFSSYFDKGKQYRLCEKYGVGYVNYELYDGEQVVPLSTVPVLSKLQNITFSGEYQMAIPFRVYESPRFEGRGRSVYDTKTDDFDAFDEIISQWLDAIRAGRVKKYIPDSMLPRDVHNGSLKHFDDFGSEYLAISASAKETVADKLETVQPDIRYEAFLSSYSAFLDLCLQGIVSPATLGIDVGKMSSADAQREKKDITGSTRNAITAVLEKVLPRLIEGILMTHDNMQGEAPHPHEVTVSFGEYGAPDFDSRVDTLGKAATSGIMSVEAQVDELWGSSKEAAWKKTEVSRIQSEKGLVDAAIPAVGDEVF